MKKVIGAVLAIFLVVFLLQGRDSVPSKEDKNTLTLYAYDSLTSEWGLLPQILKAFEKENSVKVKVVSFADTGQMLNQLLLEKKSPKADVVIGLDNVNFPKVEKEKLLQSYKPKRVNEIDEDLLFDEEFVMTPFDYGYIGFVYDSEAIEFEGPISLKEFASSKYKDKIIIEQPGLSSPGTQLLLWTKAALTKEEDAAFWNQMADTVLTVTPDWNTAYYSMFMEGEAPIVLSYLTSPAYHIDQEDTRRYKAIPIREGYIRQVEGIGVVNGTQNKEAAQKFVDYVLEDEVQNKIPTTQWIFPVLGDDTAWPAAYDEIIVPEGRQILSVAASDIAKNFDSWIEEWNKTFKVQ